MTTKTNKPLSEKDCFRLFAEYGTPAHIIRHCTAVSRVAYNIASALRSAGHDIDADLARRAGLLHDLVRTEKNHAAAAAEIVERYDPAAAAIINVHMNYDIADSVADMKEVDAVSIADRSVLEDEYVGFEKRINGIIARFADNREAVEHLQQKLQETSKIISLLEEFIGKPIDRIAIGSSVSIDRLLKRVTKPGRYIGGEMNSVRKDAVQADTHMVFCFPDLYEIGMSYTGLQIIYGLLNSLDDVYCERAFAPADDMEALMRSEGVPLFTLETHTPVSCADIIAFTLQYELSYTNILNMLDLAGIPVEAAHRDENTPFVCAGGSCACNPEPLAEVFDFIVIGDGEEILPEICRIHSEWKERGGTREEFLLTLAKKEGIYIPSLYSPVYTQGGPQVHPQADAQGGPRIHSQTDAQGGSQVHPQTDTQGEAITSIHGAQDSDPARNAAFTHAEKKYDWLPDRIKKLTIDNLDSACYPLAPIVPIVEAAHERAVCEISRGCGRGCRFCQAGYIYRPVRKRSRARVREILNAQLANTGYDEASLLSLSAGDHPEIEPLVAGLMDELKEIDVSLSLPSLRLDTISPDVLSRIASYKKSSLTFAPEAGTQRLRDVVRKNITEEDILSGVEKAIAIGWNRVKLYFMIGLPTEMYEDLDGITALASNIMHKARTLQEKGRRNFSLTVSVSNFVPKPHTPFQWFKGDSEDTLREKMYYLKDRLRSVKGVSAKFHDTRVSAVEMMLSKGDRRTFGAIKGAWALGCRFDSWREHFDYALWTQAFAEAGIPIGTDMYTDTDAPLPWDIIMISGADRELLLKEYARAMT